MIVKLAISLLRRFEIALQQPPQKSHAANASTLDSKRLQAKVKALNVAREMYWEMYCMHRWRIMYSSCGFFATTEIFVL